MMKRIMPLGASAAALAASALFALPASADTGVRGARVVTTEFTVGGADLRHAVHHRGHRRLNQFGQTRREVRRLSADALYRCDAALDYKASAIGFRRARFVHDPYVEQIGPYGFRVSGKAQLGRGRFARFQPVSCVVRRGEVRRFAGLSGLRHGVRHFDAPQPRVGFSVTVGDRW